MSEPIIFLPEALAEATEAYTWYEGREIGLGEEFYRALSVALIFVARNPGSPRKVYRDYRRLLLRRFPYAIFYRQAPEAIYIYSVFHCSQNPGKWKDRLQGQ